jgi:uncharacterized protein
VDPRELAQRPRTQASDARELITLDTSAVLALLAERDPDHSAVVGVLLEDDGPFLVPAAILGEVGYMIEVSLPAPALDTFLGDLVNDAFRYDCAYEDLPRIRELVAKYADLPLGVADAAVASCAERNGRRVLTLDRRDFDVVGRELELEVLP